MRTLTLKDIYFLLVKNQLNAQKNCEEILKQFAKKQLFFQFLKKEVFNQIKKG